ncbi:rho GDP-dissociation inhibitor 1-like [Olea europaea subsp. europaea]|uniref:Rho GDP-dissociation inhibitor 1-like n=1 Tax=Olea europaea subsp. europaea TaxID=158383 RepID=A0A8S0U8V5_OLEEU|nr:rho GDP-dissociation inhibitor 1-like [Olea europaea subsp. europaea]
MESGKREEAGPSASVREGQKQENEEGFDYEEAGFDEIDQENKRAFENFNPGPLLPLKEQIEKDKEDESLRRWKEKLLGCLESDLNGQMEPEVKFQSIGILSSDFGELNSPLPITEDQSRRLLFSLREGSDYRLKLTFTVLHNIVSGLAYTNTVWKSGLQGSEWAFFFDIIYAYITDCLHPYLCRNHKLRMTGNKWMYYV